MIKRKKLDVRSIQDPPGVCFQLELMIGNQREGFKSDATERRDDAWPDQLDHASQIAGAVLDLGDRRPAVGVGDRPRAAHHGAGYEDVFAARGRSSRADVWKLSPDLSP